MKLVRGARILQAINYIEEMTLVDLEKSIVTGFPATTKRQHATDPVQIVQLKLNPYTHTTDLLAEAVANSGGRKYDTKVLFLDVTYEDEDTNNNITFVATDGDNYHIVPISLSTCNVKVRCNCLDFYYRFANWNGRDEALYGNPPPPYRRKTQNRPPVNPDQVPGLCKHVIKTVQSLREAGLVVS